MSFENLNYSDHCADYFDQYIRGFKASERHINQTKGSHQQQLRTLLYQSSFESHKNDLSKRSSTVKPNEREAFDTTQFEPPILRLDFSPDEGRSRIKVSAKLGQHRPILTVASSNSPLRQIGSLTFQPLSTMRKPLSGAALTVNQPPSSPPPQALLLPWYKQMFFRFFTGKYESPRVVVSSDTLNSIQNKEAILRSQLSKKENHLLSNSENSRKAPKLREGERSASPRKHQTIDRFFRRTECGETTIATNGRTDQRLSGMKTPRGSQRMESCDKTNNNNNNDPSNPYDRKGDFRWTDTSTFIVALCGAIVNFANLARFPYLICFFGAIPYTFAYLTCAIIVTLPIAYFQVGMGQITQGGIVKALDATSSRARGLSLVYIILSFVTSIGHSVEVCMFCIYAYGSLTNSFPWKPVGEIIKLCNETPTAYCGLQSRLCHYNDIKDICVINQLEYSMRYFGTLKPNFENDGNAAMKVMVVFTWMLLFFISLKGMSVIFPMSLWTLSIYFVVLMCLFSFGINLPGHEKGVEIIFDVVCYENLKNPYLWTFATAHSLTSLELASPIICAFSGRHRPDSPVIPTVIVVFIIDLFVSVLAALAILPYIGFVQQRSIPSGFMTIYSDDNHFFFSILPLALSTLPGAPVFSFIFFITAVIIAINLLAAEFLALCDSLQSLRCMQRIPKYLIALFLVVCGAFVSSATLRARFYERWRYLVFANDEFADIILCFLIAITGGWLDGWSSVASEVGFLSLIIYSLGFTLYLFAITISLQIPAEKQNNVRQLLSLSLFVTVTTLALCLAVLWRRTNLPKTSLWQDVKASCWWLVIGTVEELRADLNDITVGPLPLASIADRETQYRYGRGIICCIVKKIPKSWSFALKYAAPICLVYVANYQFLFIIRSHEDDTTIAIPMRRVFDQRDHAYEGYIMGYKCILLGVLIPWIVGVIAPGLFRCLVPYERLTHKRHWLGGYEPPLKENISQFFKIFDEVGALRKSKSSDTRFFGSSGSSKHFAARFASRSSFLKSSSHSLSKHHFRRISESRSEEYSWRPKSKTFWRKSHSLSADAKNHHSIKSNFIQKTRLTYRSKFHKFRKKQKNRQIQYKSSSTRFQLSSH